MKFLTTIIGVGILFGSVAEAEEISHLKDWRAEKDVMTPLEKMGCLAETTTEVIINGQSELWTLQVIKLATGQGDYSYPMVISFPEASPDTEYYEASAQSDRPETPVFNMTLMQPANGDQSIVANRLRDRNALVNRLKADSTFTMSYLNKQGATREAQFSLRGSSHNIQTMLDTCR